VPQERHPEFERRTLRSSKSKVAPKRVENRSSFVTHEDEAYRHTEKTGIASGQDGINQPSHAKGRDKNHEASEREANEAGEM
jgi:hypothetical protein